MADWNLTSPPPTSAPVKADLISIVKLRTLLARDPNSDGLVLQRLRQVQTQFEKFTGRLFCHRVDHTQKIRLRKDRFVRLSLCPVESITSIHSWADTVAQSSAAPLEVVGYPFDFASGVFLDNCKWQNNIQVVYTGGYDEKTCPEDIQNAIQLQVSFLLDRMSPQNSSSRGRSLGNGSTNFIADDMHPIFKQACKFYMRMNP
jgi:hypothetical protein